MFYLSVCVFIWTCKIYKSSTAAYCMGTRRIKMNLYRQHGSEGVFKPEGMRQIQQFLAIVHD